MRSVNGAVDCGPRLDRRDRRGAVGLGRRDGARRILGAHDGLRFAQSTGKATAECGRRRTAVAGGFASPGFRPGEQRWRSRAVDLEGGRQARVETKGFNFGRDPADLVSFAYCVKHAPGFAVQSNKVFVGPNSPVVGGR